MPRSSIDQTNERIEEAANLLSEGWPGRRIVKELAVKHGRIRTIGAVLCS